MILKISDIIHNNIFNERKTRKVQLYRSTRFIVITADGDNE